MTEKAGLKKAEFKEFEQIVLQKEFSRFLARKKIILHSGEVKLFFFQCVMHVRAAIVKTRRNVEKYVTEVRSFTEFDALHFFDAILTERLPEYFEKEACSLLLI